MRFFSYSQLIANVLLEALHAVVSLYSVRIVFYSVACHHGSS